jgi:hypothetical protein
MITVCARWDSLQMTPELEWRLWSQLKGAFNIDRFVFTPVKSDMASNPIDQYDTIEEAIASCEGAKVFLEPTGSKGLSDIPTGQDIVLICGNTSLNNLKQAGEDETYKIATPGTSVLFSTTAVGVALAFQHGQ